MSLSCRSERNLLNHEEFETVRVTHHPAIYDLDVDALQDVKTRLRLMRDKERTLGFQKRREMRGKVEPRGSNFPGTAEKPLQKKQVFASALKRLNKEVARIKNFEARQSLSQSAHKALALKQATGGAEHPSAAATPGQGMRLAASNKRRATIPRSQIGSVSQATKQAQAVRDSRD